MEYCRIGTVWYRVSEFCYTPKGQQEIHIKQLERWRASTIKQDHGEVFFKQQAHYDSVYHAPQEIKELYKKLHAKHK